LKQHAEAEAEALPPILQRYIHQEDGMTKANFVTTLVTLAFTAAPCATSIAEQAAVLDAEAQKALQRAVANPQRSDANRARDKYRHPVETLAFFGIQPTHTVVEIWPGGGWYTEILAPYLAGRGRLIVASPAGRGSEGINKRLDADPALFGKVERANFPTLLGGSGVRAGTADAVLTFRNVHNWGGGYMHPDKKSYSDEAFREMFAMLKPGGTLGIVDHRLPESASADREKSSGYIKVSTVRALAEKAGFEYVGASEVNANPRDKADWPDGVWTLPPALAKGDTDREQYLAIGESDRMTLKFVKPKR
jgi:predicted methyltransferase